MDIQVNIHKIMDTWRLISLKHGYPFVGIHVPRIPIVECPCIDIPARISMWISTHAWITEDRHSKIMNIHMDNRGFLEIHVWICFCFSDQGGRSSKAYKVMSTFGQPTFWYFMILPTFSDRNIEMKSLRKPVHLKKSTSLIPVIWYRQFP